MQVRVESPYRANAFCLSVGQIAFDVAKRIDYESLTRIGIRHQETRVAKLRGYERLYREHAAT